MSYNVLCAYNPDHGQFAGTIAGLKAIYGKPKLPAATGPFELVLWENACYLLSDKRRAAVFEGPRQQVGLDAAAIWKADKAVAASAREVGGMQPETRVFRWREIARITLEQFSGNLDNILKGPFAAAKRALLQFPNIDAPGAEKILMFCGMAPGLPLEWNGLRVLTRMGYGRSGKNYAAMYKSVQEAIAPELPRSAAVVSRAHLLLREQEGRSARIMDRYATNVRLRGCVRLRTGESNDRSVVCPRNEL